MMKTVEATIETDGRIHLLEPVCIDRPCRAIVTIIDDEAVSEAALLSQNVLARDWDRPEEDAAWSHLQ
ncbi:MAG: hypothetical protein RBS80_04505 [Thermoguttaceae bacterium]|jgi:hypothetical protein|nr:hypothetical protein [Thermoguttaceae bacterium]